jgi:hypothetical protein
MNGSVCEKRNVTYSRQQKTELEDLLKAEIYIYIWTLDIRRVSRDIFSTRVICDHLQYVIVLGDMIRAALNTNPRYNETRYIGGPLYLLSLQHSDNSNSLHYK